MKNNVFRRISALLLAAVMLLGGASALAKSKKNKKTPTPSPTVSAAEKEMYVADDGVFLLEDMSADAEKLFSLPRGEKVTVVDQEQDEQGLCWLLVEYEEEIGFVSRDQLSEEPPVMETPAPTQDPDRITVQKDGEYSDREHVAEYLRKYGRLPKNYISKREAQALGWVSSYGNLWKVAPGKSIGGDRFGNYEGLLPDKKGRTWYECDIDFDGTYRNAKRILYSSDGLIYYTEDHYQTFEDITKPE